MIIEQIRIDSAVEQVLDDLISFISITQSCPAVDSLCHSPSGTFICTVLHGYLCCCKPLCMILCNEVSREKSEKVGHMTVVISFSECSSTCSMVKGCLCIPFFDLSAVADLDRSFQVSLVCFPCSYQICICSKDFCCFDCIFIYLPDQCLPLLSSSDRYCLLNKMYLRYTHNKPSSSARSTVLLPVTIPN